MFRKLTVVAGLGALVVGPAMGASLAVTGAAALEGSFGLEIQLGSAPVAYVEEAVAHNAESTYTARFLLDPGTATIQPNKAIRFIAWGATDGAVGQHVVCHLRRDNPAPLDQYMINCWGRETGGAYEFYGGMFHSFVSANPPTRQYEMSWSASNPSGSNNGSWSLKRIDNGNTLSRTNQDYDHDITNVRVGALASTGANGTGAIYFDSFSAFR